MLVAASKRTSRLRRNYSDSPLVARLGHHQPNERLLVDIDLTPLVRRKMGWRVERDRRELEDAFGLDHFEGRT